MVMGSMGFGTDCVCVHAEMAMIFKSTAAGRVKKERGQGEKRR